MRTLIFTSLVICFLMMPYQLAAGQFDGSVPLLCAVVRVIDCGVEGDCEQITPEIANIPQFLRIDFKKKEITATKESGRKEKSEIKTLERVEGRIIMQGTGGSRGWTMVISEDTGKMSATASDEQSGFVVFGACTPFQ